MNPMASRTYGANCWYEGCEEMDDVSPSIEEGEAVVVVVVVGGVRLPLPSHEKS